MLAKLQRWFLTGVILIAPAYITVIVILWLFDHLDAPLRSVIRAVLPQAAGPGVGVAATFLLILAVGAVASTFVAQKIIALLERLLESIPLIRTLYSGVKQLLSPFSPEESARLQRVVVVEWPSDETYALGFLVRPDACVGPDGRTMASVLLPSNHLHLGYVVLIPEARIYPVDMTIEQGLKFLVSMGAGLDRPMRLSRPPLAPTVTPP